MLTRRAFLAALVAQVVTVPKDSLPRAQTEVELMNAMLEDIRNMHVGVLDWKLRKRIAHLMAKLSTEN